MFLWVVLLLVLVPILVVDSARLNLWQSYSHADWTTTATSSEPSLYVAFEGGGVCRRVVSQLLFVVVAVVIILIVVVIVMIIVVICFCCCC